MQVYGAYLDLEVAVDKAYHRYRLFLQDMTVWYGRALKIGKNRDLGIILFPVLLILLVVILAGTMNFFKTLDSNTIYQSIFLKITFNALAIIIYFLVGAILMSVVFAVISTLEIFSIRRKVDTELRETARFIKNEAPQLGKLIRYMEKLRDQLYPLPPFIVLIFIEKKEQCRKLKLYKTYSKKGFEVWKRVSNKDKVNK